MERRSPAQTIAANVRVMAADSGFAVEAVSEAAQVARSKIEGSEELTFVDVCNLSGLFGVRPEVLFEGVS
ncbi:hypothetical protein [Microbacterium sp. HSID17254]|uniref:hypothetical protein n=1 Tax=Microbacterium sp. HSID17254 TaxID=2419509 RepID=UPI000F85EE8E|nr:hypothetical protein [Microbacterium sp. HSID17254]